MNEEVRFVSKMDLKGKWVARLGTLRKPSSAQIGDIFLPQVVEADEAAALLDVPECPPVAAWGTLCGRADLVDGSLLTG